MIVFPEALLNSKNNQIAIENMKGFEEQGNFQHENGNISRTQELKGDSGTNQIA